METRLSGLPLTGEKKWGVSFNTKRDNDCILKKKAGRKDQPAFRPAISATSRPFPRFIVSTTVFILVHHVYSYHAITEKTRKVAVTQYTKNNTSQPYSRTSTQQLILSFNSSLTLVMTMTPEFPCAFFYFSSKKFDLPEK
ncbi:hypothetical protein [Chlorobaculum limnaeum]|uniref:hypothetical protein n=1 Tax=Chlorobaculum limnaeum TaxID=274537 RepID=UPI001470A690|nr:hypothetical protein [Chlorobaculum limnaeum]